MSSGIDNVKFITLTNDGYLDYTLNCLKSLELIEFHNKLHCYVIGEKGYNILKSKGYSSHLLKADSENDIVFSKFRQDNWHNITKRKFEIIYNCLKENEYVCFTDGDIVFQNNKFLKYCLTYVGDNDMLIQNDAMSNKNKSNLCSGFMFIKSNKKTLDIFNPINVQKHVKPGWDDQIYINKFKHTLNFQTLPLEYFPNGQYYYNSVKPFHPMMIHFNWVVGHEKKKKMKKHNKWFI